MKIKYRFLINKEANFAYWLQALKNWSWYFSLPDYEYFIKIAGGFSSSENQALEKLLNLLQQENNGYHLLYNLYSGQEIESLKEREEYKSIQAALFGKFEGIWQKETQNLLSWKNLLVKKDFARFEESFSKIMIFLGYPMAYKSSEIIIQLLVCGGNIPAAHVQPKFKDFMILNISHIPFSESERVVGVVIHETIHLLHYKRGLLSELIQQAYEKIIVPQGIELKNGYKWQRFILESIVKSIALNRFNNYIGRKLEYSLEQLNMDNDFTMKKPLSEQSYYFLERLIASRTRGLTEEYLNKMKTIDFQFVSIMAERCLAILR